MSAFRLNLKLLILVTYCAFWLLISIVRTPAATGSFKDMNLDASWVIGLAQSFRGGAIEGRDFHFTYGPAAQAVAAAGASLNMDASAYPALPLIMLSFAVYSILLFAAFVWLVDDLDWKAVVLLAVMAAVLNLFSEPTSFRVLTVLASLGIFYRGILAKSQTSHWLLAISAGAIALLAQLTSLELGLYAIAAIVAASLILAVFPGKSPRRDIAFAAIAVAAYFFGNVAVAMFFRFSSATYGHYAGLFEYQRLSLEMIRGYTLTGGSPWSLGKLQTIGLLATIAYTLIVVLIRLRTMTERRLAWIVPLTLCSIIVMKSATVRSDTGHITLASSPFVLLFVLAGREELKRWRTAVPWMLFAAALVLAWPWSGPYAFKDFGSFLLGRAHAWQKLQTLREARTPADALPEGLMATLGTSESVLNFPHEIYMGSALSRLFIAPTLQAYAAESPKLQQYYVASMLEKRPPFVLYGIDGLASEQIDSVQYVTRLPLVFQYLYEHFYLRQNRKYGPGFYVLEPRAHPISMTFTPVSIEVAGHPDHLEIQARNANDCSLVRMDLNIRYPSTLVFGRPASGVVAFILGGRAIQFARLLALENGREFHTLISLIQPADSPALFDDSALMPPSWDAIQIDFQKSDRLDVLPSSSEVLAVGCFNRAAPAVTPKG